MTVDTVKGYAIKDTNKYTDFELVEYKLRTEEADDITVHVECCGCCASDHHTISGGWGPLANKFCVTGHEIVGEIVSMGSNVKGFKLGQRVGIGAQSGSCGECKPCKTDNEQYCPQGKDTYNAVWYNGEDCQGGYSTHVRAQQRFVFALPDEISSEHAASMMCAGLTVFSPLLRNGAGPGKKVGILGIGGLGHYAIMFAAAMGAEVYAFSTSDSKKDDALKMGAKHFVNTRADKDFAKKLKGELDLIISSASSADLPLNDYLQTLGVHGQLCFVGMPETDWPALKSQTMASNGCYIGSSHIGSGKEAAEMLKLAVKHNIKPWIQTMPMKDAAKGIQALEKGTVRYRTVFIQDIDK